MFPRRSLLILAILFTMTTAAADKAPLRIATDGAYPPYVATDSAGRLYGLEADLVADLCRRMARRCEWVRQSFEGAIPSLQRGRFDAIVASLSITEERRNAIEFSVPYFQGPTVFVVPRKSPLLAKLGPETRVTLDQISQAEKLVLENTRRALKGTVVGIERASTHERFLKTYFADAIRIRSYATIEELFLDFSAARVDLALVGLGEMGPYSIGQKKAAESPPHAGPGFMGGVLGHGVAIGLRKGDENLRQAFNRAILEANRDGTIRKLSIRWFGADGSPPLPQAPPAR